MVPTFIQNNVDNEKQEHTNKLEQVDEFDRSDGPKETASSIKGT